MSEFTDGLWRRFGSLELADLPDDVVTVAHHCVLDWFGCALAGSREPLAGILRDEFGMDGGDCTLIGSPRRADALRAAMVNGATGHALDFDDTSPVMGGHATVPLLPAVLAVAEELDRSGVLAARLAARGYTASSDAIDGNQGFAQAAGNGALDRGRIDRLAEGWATPATLFEFHAACHLTHAGIEATRSILADGVQPEEIQRITMTVNPSILDVCGIPDPTNGLEAKFSLRGTQALLVQGLDTAAVASFEDGPINRPAARWRHRATSAGRTPTSTGRAPSCASSSTRSPARTPARLRVCVSDHRGCEHIS